MKKRLIYLFILFCMMSCSCNKGNQEFTITGSVVPTDLNGDKVYLQTLNSGFETILLDSAFITDGEFAFEGVAPLEPSFVLLSVVKPRNEDSFETDCSMVLEAGDIVVVVDSNYVMHATGTPINDMTHQCAQIIKQYIDSCDTLLVSDLTSDEQRERLQQLCTQRNEDMLKTILPNINYAVTRTIVSEYYTLFSIDQLDVLYNAVDENNRESIKDQYNSITESVMGQALGAVSIPDAEGKMVDFYEIFAQHDYTLVDFWASWCGPCIRNMVDIKDLHARHSGPRFEVIGVSLDDSREKWLSAVENIASGWIDVSNLEGWECDLSRRLDIRYVPASILFDRYGNIISRNPSMTELEIFLAK